MREEDKFSEKFGNDVVEKLFEAFLHYVDNEESVAPFDFYDVSFTRPYRYDYACEYTADDGSVWYIVGRSCIENGDRISGFSQELLRVEIPEPTMYTYVPHDRGLSDNRWGVYLLWRKTEWFKEKERAYNYDRHVAPGYVTEKHYRCWAESKGLSIASVEDAEELIAERAKVGGAA